jgi:chaperone BCS1
VSSLPIWPFSLIHHYSSSLSFLSLQEYIYSEMSYSPDVAILAPTGHVPTDVVPTQSYPPATSFPTELWPEPLNTPGIIPRHLKRSATASFPILEVLQRILSRLRPQGTTSDLEKVLALIGLYQAARPVYGYLRDLFFWVFTVEITVAESDPIAREVLAWMGENVLRGAHTRSAMLVTGGLDTVNLNAYTGHAQSMRFSPPPPPGSRQDRVHDEVACLPPIGTRIFWYV